MLSCTRNITLHTAARQLNQIKILLFHYCSAISTVHCCVAQYLNTSGIVCTCKKKHFFRLQCMRYHCWRVLFWGRRDTVVLWLLLKTGSLDNAIWGDIWLGIWLHKLSPHGNLKLTVKLFMCIGLYMKQSGFDTCRLPVDSLLKLHRSQRLNYAIIIYKYFTILKNYVSVKSKLQHPPPPPANPGHLTSFPAREEGIWLT